MSDYPLIDIANQRKINQATDLATNTRLLDVEVLVDAWRQTRDNAPRRHAVGKRYLQHRASPPPALSNREEEHMAIRLARGKASIPTDSGAVDIVEYQMPLKAALSDAGVGKVDLVGVHRDSGRVWLIELKRGSASTRGETPLRALLEGFAYSAFVEANLSDIVGEIVASGIPAADIPVGVAIAGPPGYWEAWRTTQAAGKWEPAIDRLMASLTEQTGVVFMKMLIPDDL